MNDTLELENEKDKIHIRKIGINGTTKTITLPKNWGKAGEYVKIILIDDKTIRISIIDA